jgi:hypothetical protein
MRETMAEFETLKAEYINFGRNNFIEVAKKKAVSNDGEREFLSISRGFYLDDGSKRWKASITLPDEDDKRKKIADLLTTL